MADTNKEKLPQGFKLEDHKKRVAKAWQERLLWQKLYDDACEFAIPFRRPASRLGKAANTVERLFDNTAVVSAFRSAGQLHQDLFPSAQKSFRLSPGPVAEMALGNKKVDFAREIDNITKVVTAFFLLPEFDCASHEMCIDLLVGTGTLAPLPGNRRAPIRWICFPFDEVAIETDAYGWPVLISWKTRLTRRQIVNEWPGGVYPDEFKNLHNSNPDDEVQIWQDFVLDPRTELWHFVAHLEKSEAPIVAERYRTQPVAVPRYYRVPGEPYGRGPILLALPTIKTLNKAVEITLKAAAIQMLGIWGYRPGGAFNPETVRVGPAQFWPMGSTGGVLGPDVTRLDTSAGRLDVSQLITRELRVQIQAALQDENLPADGATPRSATEIMERIKRTAQNYLGAFGRLVNEIHPVIVRRVMEILYDKGLLKTQIDIDTLLVRIDVLSPIASALRSQALEVIVQFAELVLSMRGPQGIDLLMKVDDALRHMGLEMGVPPEFLMTADEQKVLEHKIQRALAQFTAAQQQQQQNAAAAAASGATQPAPVAA